MTHAQTASKPRPVSGWSGVGGSRHPYGAPVKPPSCRGFEGARGETCLRVVRHRCRQREPQTSQQRAPTPGSRRRARRRDDLVRRASRARPAGACATGVRGVRPRVGVDQVRPDTQVARSAPQGRALQPRQALTRDVPNMGASTRTPLPLASFWRPGRHGGSHRADPSRTEAEARRSPRSPGPGSVSGARYSGPPTASPTPRTAVPRPRASGTG